MNNKTWKQHLGEQATKVYDWGLINNLTESTDLSDKIGLELINELQKIKPTGKILDVGCDIGNYVKHFKDQGYQAEGITLSSQHARKARQRGLNVKVMDCHELKYPDETIDIIYNSHLIEHLLSPIIFIRECNRVLKKGGLLVIRTPTNNNDYAFNPSHYICFSKESIFHLLNQTGFTFKTFRIPQFKNEKQRKLLEEFQIIAEKTKEWKPLLNYDETKNSTFYTHEVKLE